uniref:Delta-1-pyrroline-5-carboxylate synthase n=1 Tax=Betula platyphylla TaxID=78630 RepID=A0A0H4CUP3_BETPL|nr:delta1-pyrroline-5-carboxylate synthase 1 [Betula platyphylla]
MTRIYEESQKFCPVLTNQPERARCAACCLFSQTNLPKSRNVIPSSSYLPPKHVPPIHQTPPHRHRPALEICLRCGASYIILSSQPAPTESAHSWTEFDSSTGLTALDIDIMDRSRAFVKDVKRLIIKVGTAVVTRADGRLALGRLGALCEQIKDLNSQGYEVIVVSSGAVGLGRQRLRYRRLVNSSFADLQKPQVEFDGKACAAVGQNSLMALYDTLFSQLDLTSAQLLVTDNDFRDKDFRNQLSETVKSLLALKVIPIFNENDAVSTRKAPYEDSSGIFWDNDSLAALLALELKADLLVLLSDVEGLYSGPPSDPRSKLIHTYIKERHQGEITFGDKSRVGRGGMTAKVKAAVYAADAGIPVVITSGYAAENIIKVLQGECVGTLFHHDAHLWAPVREVGAREMAIAARESSRRLQISSLANSIRVLANMEDPIGCILKKTEVADGLVLEKTSSPLGVLLIVFESRPDALVQIASLAIRSGNGLLLKGGKEAKQSNAILHKIITGAIPDSVGKKVIGLVTSREEIPDLLKLDDVIDLVIPRGSNQLVSQIKNSTKIPVLGHADGICHVYIDKSANMDMAKQIVLDAKVDYPAACNAMETLLVHKDLILTEGLNELIVDLRIEGVTLYGGPRASSLLNIPETRAHTDCVIAEDHEVAEVFLHQVDSAAVFHNASTRFCDGARFGLGAEVGISTSRIHARGPVGVEGLLTTRWILRGSGQVVNGDKGIAYIHKDVTN